MDSVLDLSRFSSPHSNRGLVHTRDLDKAKEVISSNIVAFDYKCLDNTWPSGNALFHNYISLGDISLSYISYGRNVFIRTGELRDAYLLQIVPTGECTISYRGQRTINSNGNWSIASPGSNFEMLWSRDCGVFELIIERKYLHSAYRVITGEDPEGDIRFDFDFRNDPGLTNCLSSLLSYLCHEIEKLEPGSIRDYRSSTVTIGQLKELLLTLILENQPHNHSDVLEKALLPAAPRHVQKAVDYIHAHLSGSIILVDIADAAGMGTRTLHKSFSKFYNTSPTGYIKSARLDKARKELRAASPLETSVTEIAFNCGFTHLSRFSCHYFERFGEYPQETLRKR